jgi:N-acyl-D-aspartate/D-glutamate deacylase
MKNLFGIALAIALPLAALSPCTAPMDDLVFEGGRVVDGTGAPWFVADVSVRDGRISAIGDLGRRAARRRIDAHSEGFRYVAVNGVLVIDGGKLTGKTPGRALRGPGYVSRLTVQSSKLLPLNFEP